MTPARRSSSALMPADADALAWEVARATRSLGGALLREVCTRLESHSAVDGQPRWDSVLASVAAASARSQLQDLFALWRNSACPSPQALAASAEAVQDRQRRFDELTEQEHSKSRRARSTV